MKSYLTVASIILTLFSCKLNSKERFFTQEEYRTGIRQDVNADVLARIEGDSNITSDSIAFTFFYVSNEKQKLEALSGYLKAQLKDYQIIDCTPYNQIWQLEGVSVPIQLKLESINVWEQMLWEIGYQFDCKLDGWETT